jgi:Concanavalin A-like lectin/glucanases superfamily
MAAVAILLLASGGIVAWIKTHQSPQTKENTASPRIEIVQPGPEKEEITARPQIEKATTAPQTSNAVAAVLPPGLVGWWKAEGDAQDSAGTHHGALVEGAVFGPAKAGQGFLLNGYGAHVSVPASPAWAFGQKDFTMALWAHFASASGTKALIASDGGTDGKDEWVLWVSDGVLELRMGGPAAGGSGGAMGSARIKAALGPWCHIAVTRSGQAFRILVNGTERLSTTVLHEMPQSQTALTFGCAGDAFHFHGTLDDIRIYDRALSNPEIKALVGAQSGTSTSGTNSPQ